MPNNLSALHRLRIEGRVWALDQLLYDLPRKQRIATRREVRSNVVSAAQSVGASQALANLGTSRQLAEEYLQVQFGPAPRASWLSAAVFLLAAVPVMISILGKATQSFADGVIAASPHATGQFSWSGLAVLQTDLDYTFHDGRFDVVGGALSPFAYLIIAIGTIAAGRLWRLLPRLRSRSDTTTSRRAG